MPTYPSLLQVARHKYRDHLGHLMVLPIQPYRHRTTLNQERDTTIMDKRESSVKN